MSDSESSLEPLSNVQDDDGSEVEEVGTPNTACTACTGASASQNTTSANIALKTLATKKRRRRTRADVIWSYSRKHLPGIEPERCDAGRRLWYCKTCPSYSVSSTSGARAHMGSIHHVEVATEAPRGVKKAKFHEIGKLLSQQALKKQEDALNSEKRTLKDAARPALVKAAWLRLVVRRDLPHRSVTWPELHSFVHTINYMATGCLPTSATTVGYSIKVTFRQKQLQVREALQSALSLIHITTDTWNSPNSKELQAFNAHFVDKEGKLRKALINLVELENGHSGEEVAKHLLKALDFYGIRDTLGFVTGDNHSANDALCRAIAEQKEDWNPVDYRLRCIGHIINLAVQAFLFAKDEEAVEEAERQSQRLGRDLDELLASLGVAVNTQEGKGWSTILPLQKLHDFVTKLSRSDRLQRLFKKLTKGRVIHTPNIARWNSWFYTIDNAVELQFEMGQFIQDNDELSNCELLLSEWKILRDTLKFLQPFKEVTKRCEGDHVTLDQMQESMDFLVNHLDEQIKLHKVNKPFIECIMTAWYTLDKYYNKIDEIGAYAAATLLCPNKRRAYLQAVWKSKWIKPGLRRAEELFHKYEKDPFHLAESPIDVDSDQEAIELSAYERWQQQRFAKITAGMTSSEFTRFVNAPADAIAFTDDYTVLDWWLESSQQRTYPRLSRMAIDILSAPAMSAEAERVFSRARRQISYDKDGLKASTIAQKECLKSWQIQELVDETMDVVERSEVELQSDNELL